MSDQINRVQQQEALRIIEVQNALAVEMARARGDVALEQLEVSLNNLINQSRIDRMTTEDLSRLRDMDQHTRAILADPTAIQRYPFDEAKADGLFAAEFYNEPLRSEFLNLYQNYTPQQHAQLQGEVQTFVEERQRRQAEVREAREAAGFTPDQADFLTAPDLQLATLVAQVEAEGGTPESKMTRLRELMSQKVRTSFNEWLSDSRQLMETMGGDDLAAFESGLAEEALNVRQTSTQVVGNVAGGAGNAVGNVFGNFAQFRFTPLAQHPFLSQVFNTRGSISAAYTCLSASTGEVDRLVSQQVQALTGNLSYEQLASRFVLIPENPTEMSIEQLRALETKMETVPKFFRNKDFANQYYDYLRTSIGGDLTMADDFQEWFATLEMNPIIKMFYQFIMMLPDEVIDWVDGSEDNKTDAEIHGEDLLAIRDELENRGLTPTDTEDSETEPEGEREGNLGQQSEYRTLLATYRELTGDPNAEPQILYNGESILAIADFPSNLVRSLTTLNSVLETEPSAVELLGKNLELTDLIYLAEHYGDQHPDGVNVEFSTTGVNIYADLNHYLPDGFTSWFNQEYLVGGAAAGVGVALLAGITWPVTLGALAGAGISYVVGEMGWITLEDVSYEDLDASTLGSIVDRITAATDTIREATAQSVRQLQNLTTTERQAFLESSGLLEIQEDIPEFWGDYQLTSLDVLLFNEFENGSGEHSFDQSNWFSMFHADNIGEGDEYINETGQVVTADRDIRGFQVEGTGSWWGLFNSDNYYDYRFENVESFFAWLRTSPRAQELQAQLDSRP